MQQAVQDPPAEQLFVLFESEAVLENEEAFESEAALESKVAL